MGSVASLFAATIYKYQGNNKKRKQKQAVKDNINLDI